MRTLVLHMTNEDPVVGEVEEEPVKTDTLIFLNNPRRRDGRSLPYLEENVTKVAWPVSRLSFIEVMPIIEQDY
jgi:hypothetical protein